MTSWKSSLTNNHHQQCCNSHFLSYIRKWCWLHLWLWCRGVSVSDNPQQCCNSHFLPYIRSGDGWACDFAAEEFLFETTCQKCCNSHLWLIKQYHWTNNCWVIVEYSQRLYHSQPVTYWWHHKAQILNAMCVVPCVFILLDTLDNTMSLLLPCIINVFCYGTTWKKTPYIVGVHTESEPPFKG